MLVRTKDFESFIKAYVEPKKIVCCNNCKYKEKCIENKVISYVTYPTGEKGYAKTGITRYFDNTCNFPIDKY